MPYIKIIFSVVYTLAAGLFSAILVAALGSGIGDEFWIPTLVGAAIILPLTWSVVHIWRKIWRSWKSNAIENSAVQSTQKKGLIVKIIITVFALLFLFLLIA